MSTERVPLLNKGDIDFKDINSINNKVVIGNTARILYFETVSEFGIENDFDRYREFEELVDDLTIFTSFLDAINFVGENSIIKPKLSEKIGALLLTFGIKGAAGTYTDQFNNTRHMIALSDWFGRNESTFLHELQHVVDSILEVAEVDYDTREVVVDSNKRFLYGFATGIFGAVGLLLLLDSHNSNNTVGLCSLAATGAMIIANKYIPDSVENAYLNSHSEIRARNTEGRVK